MKIGWLLQRSGEAVHTSTFLGHPASCAAALAVLDEVTRAGVAEDLRVRGRRLVEELSRELEGTPAIAEVRGLGFMIGIEFGGESGAGRGARVARAALAEGLVTLPAGGSGQVLELTPAWSLTAEQESWAVSRLAAVIGRTP